MFKVLRPPEKLFLSDVSCFMIVTFKMITVISVDV